MKFRMLLALLAVVAIGLSVVGHSSPAYATGIGGNIDQSEDTATPSVGGIKNVFITLTTSPTDPFSGTNVGIVYNTSKDTLLGITDCTGLGTAGTTFPAAPAGAAPCPAGPGFYASSCARALASNLGGALVAPQAGGVIGCTSTSIPAAAPAGSKGVIAIYTFRNISAGATGTHMIRPLEAGAGASSFSTYTTNDLDSSIQTDTYTVTGPQAVIAPSPFPTLLETSVAPPSDVTITKTSCASPIVEGSTCSFTITVTNPSVGTSTPTVTVTDNVPAAFTVGTPTTTAGSCTAAGVNPVVCNVGALAPGGGTATITIPVTSVAGSGGTSPQNCATFTSAPADASPGIVAPGDDFACATVQIQPKNVGFRKSPALSNLFLANCDPTNPAGQCFGQEVNTGSFDEILSNANDPFGLGGISFNIHFDPTQFLGFAICNSNAAAPEDAETGVPEANEGGAGAPSNACDPTSGFVDIGPLADLMQDAGRTVNCSISIVQNGTIQVACVSTGPLGTGPVFAGDQVVAHVHKVPQPFLVESIRPNKENGDVSVIKDDQVTVTNTGGQPLNGNCAGDSDFFSPSGSPFEDAALTIPDAVENCAEGQGDLLPGVGPGGVLTSPVSINVETIRRLEGDVNADCSVDVQDMQIEASKFGQSIGSLLFNTFFDVNEPLQHGDGEIDINDVQFVFGRFGSECSSPIPAQPPQLPPVP